MEANNMPEITAIIEEIFESEVAFFRALGLFGNEHRSTKAAIAHVQKLIRIGISPTTNIRFLRAMVRHGYWNVRAHSMAVVHRLFDEAIPSWPR